MKRATSLKRTSTRAISKSSEKVQAASPKEEEDGRPSTISSAKIM
jgi:hypothetical protein